MSNALAEELLKQNETEVKSNIQRIVSSYRHVWDLYTELLQNGADALVEKFGMAGLGEGQITLRIDTEKRSITIEDNGVGIAESDIPRILAIGRSLKRESGKGRYGFMGFGFSYVAFQTDLLTISSARDGRKATRTYKNLFAYAFADGALPNSEEEAAGIKSTETSESSGTTIVATFPKDFPVEAIGTAISAGFDLAKNEKLFEAVLRTKTVVGSVDPVFDGTTMFKFILEINGKQVTVPTGYLTTREIVKQVLHGETQFYTLPEYKKIVDATQSIPTSSKDVARRALLLEEKVSELVIGTRNPIKARVLVSATSKSHINQFNSSLGIAGEQPYFSVEHGMWLSLAGMPTGVCLDSFDEHSDMLPYTVLVDIADVSVKQELDAGRKGISQYRARQIGDSIRTLLREHGFFEYRRYVIGGADSRVTDPLYDAKKWLREKLDGRTKRTTGLNQEYFPPAEEQEVISLFTELCARGLLVGYKQKVLSGFQVYDGLFEYDLARSAASLLSDKNHLGIHASLFDKHGSTLARELFVEFKVSIDGLYGDIKRNRKSVADIDVLVCWSVDFEKREELLKTKGDTLIERDPTRNVFYGVTHYLQAAGRVAPLPIIELKTVLDTLFPPGK